MPKSSIAPSEPHLNVPGRRARRARERRRARLLAVPVVAATLGLIAAASIGAAAVTGAVDDGQSTVPVVSSEKTDGVTYTVSGSVPGQLIGTRDLPVVQNAAAVAPDGTASPGVQWPVDMSVVSISDGFGPRNSPCSGCSSNHRGLDLAGPQGTRVGSIANGIVIESVPTDSAGLGAHVVVEHRIDGLQVRSVYAHFVAGSPAVKVGDQVKTGQLVGLLGNTGASTGPHLHLETIVDGAHVDPQKFLNKYADGVAVDIFGEVPTWNPPTGDPDEKDYWEQNEDTRVPPPDAVPDTTLPAATPPASTPPKGTSTPTAPPTQSSSPTPPPPSTTPSGEPETASPEPSQSANPTPPSSSTETKTESTSETTSTPKS
ncbi:murein DD-endopeptidase MepM/ murein hydrolase activator NlpD [Pseudoclavibacter sp. JAI123]|uniref:M23 family metallopeptidase n=1 Tax=Pseudoclavibacter sp. JAI123 TaxID=2723065 RepID=UPI0015CA20C7|nr:M23 family metallopeptidase [Pseudoclavibacter sp. JAI123]NYF13455.1 murein DD-endopeptidase MepM/ murein hydrolase activator NlpD [Pseudoclavibacter sp. JAI123]